MSLHSKNKNGLFILYEELEGDARKELVKRFRYENLVFYFNPTHFKTSERLMLTIEIPDRLIYEKVTKDEELPLQHYLLKYLNGYINEYYLDNINKNKGDRVQSYIEVQPTNEIIIKRNGIRYDKSIGKFILHLLYIFPLINNTFVNAKSAFRFIKDILNIINTKCLDFNSKYNLKTLLITFKNQQLIREYLANNNYVSFIANGSMLPRIDGSNVLDENAIPFKSPKENEIQIRLLNNEVVTGMGIKSGITVLTGGGYSGKTTILEAIERGIYNHEVGDGREYCITISSALRIQAEDGRYISHYNLSSFFRYIGLNKNVKDFSTDDASGSVSEAANIIDAINLGSKLLLIDEDKSATNFMIKDDTIKKIIKNDPIIPFTDRIKEIYERFKVSTIVVVGGTSEYLKYADNVIMLDQFKLKNITNKCQKFIIKHNNQELKNGNFQQKYKISFEPSSFIYYKIAKNDNSKKIIIGEYSADITNIQGVVSDYQFNFISRLLFLILIRNEYHNIDIYKYLMKTIKELKNENLHTIIITSSFEQSIWFEDIRTIDLMNVLIRLRGLELK